MNERQPEFDFDDWARLYQQDPQAFEARRQAVLALELAKGTPAQAAAARQMLTTFERTHQNAGPDERMIGAGKMMLDSVRTLNEQMGALGDALRGKPSPKGGA
ncbi:MAG: DUF3135 domain-containing protein [Burkholderiaceae bacterium]